MRSAARWRPIRLAARPIALLAVVLGLVAMHSLGTGAHGPTALAGRAVPAVGQHAGVPASPGHAGESATVTAGGSMSHERMPACVAVLVALLALLAPAALRLLSGICSRPPAPRRPSIYVSRAPPRALLAQICVLRT